jgi:NAD(P)-dependent dehydrogenase (short-subunit alcohol dehydrogenase family)
MNKTKDQPSATRAPIVIITGAAFGIGWATSQHFANNGYLVVLVDSNVAAAKAKAESLGPNHFAIACDVGNEQQVKQAIDQAMQIHGRIDVLVNNAGIGDQPVATIDQSMEGFDRVINVHLRGTYLFSREVAPIMITQGAGAIVNLSSITALGGIPGRNAYGAAKAGISAMTRSMASEWATNGLRVNAVAPGYVRTELINRLIQSGALDEAKIKHRTPMGRIAEPVEIARAILFLASDNASFITGATLSVDGGWAAFGGAQ